MSTSTLARQHTRFTRRAAGCATVTLCILTAAACSPERLVVSGSLPPNVPDPGVTKTPAGALAAYRGALVMFRNAFAGGSGAVSGDYVSTTGMLTDELQANGVGEPMGSDVGAGSPTSVDSRTLPEYQDPAFDRAGLYQSVYHSLQQVRGQAQEARGLLHNYAGDSAPALIGHLDAMEGYADIFLADLFCSGIPLSSVDYSGDYTYQSGSPTSAVYQRAISLFDSARTLAGDSARIQDLAAVGTGRALLALGQYAQAAQAVANVPDGFHYLEMYAGMSTTGAAQTATNFAEMLPDFLWLGTVADREGGNGLDYLSSGDPRTAATGSGTNQYGITLYHPDKYATDGSSPIVLADWVEARLIEAEAALQAGDVATWLMKVNHLRETAITPALPDTTDPGTPATRVDLTFRERAFWLFLTGHRQGDLRRLIRQYGRDPSTAYPSGPYPGGTMAYGGAVNAPIPAAERAYNAKFAGCLGRGA